MCWFQFFISGVFYGLSPLALPVARAFAEKNAYTLESGIFFYGFAVLMLAQSLTCCIAAFYIEQGPLKRKKAFIMGGQLLWPVGLACLALSVQLRQPRLLLFVAFPLMGVAIGVQVGYLHLVVTSIMWGKDVNKGQALTGGASAFGALAWTLIFGEVIHGFGFGEVTVALWIFCGLHSAGILFGLMFFNPSLYLDPMSTAGSEIKGTQSMSFKDLALDWRVYVFVFVVEAFFFAGISMKTLMSELFEELMNLEYIHAVRYSGACLAAYFVARSVSPLLTFGDRIFTLFIIVLVSEGAAYALTPWAIRLEHGTLGIYTCFRVAGGIGFAVLLSNTAVLLVRVFGSENVARISGIFLATECFIGLGPSMAFAIHIGEVRAGKDGEQSYDMFFYICAAIVWAAAGGTALLRCAAKRCDPTVSGQSAPSADFSCAPDEQTKIYI
jgi:hypothetical protein